MKTENGTMKVADLHLHTTASDGKLSPAALVAAVAAAGISAISITDHDSFGAYPEAIPAAKKSGLELIPGVELNATVGAKEVHLLGYFVDVQNRGLKRLLQANHKIRRTRALAILDNLDARGLSLSPASVLRKTDNGVIARPHIAEAMVSAGLVRTYQQAFDMWIGDGRPANVPKPDVDPEKVIGKIHGAGGVAILAHPGAAFRPADLDRLVDAGLDGIEVVHPSHSQEIAESWRNTARGLNLLMSGGSDFHDPAKGGDRLGAYTVPYTFVTAIARKCRAHVG